MDIDPIAFTGAGTPGTRHIRPASGSIDTLAVLPQPRAHFLKPFHLARFNGARRHGPHVKQQIAIAARAANQGIQTFLQRFHLVIRFPRPLSADGDAGFPGPVVLEAANGLFRCIVVARQPGAVVEDDMGLQFPDHFEETLRIPILGRATQPVKPDDVDLSIVRADFPQLPMHIFDILRVGCRPVIRMMPVRRGVVESHPQPGLVTGVRQFLNHIAFEG
ncbi:MAG: hypothetical protein BWY09_00817 [Candidatus Hydrogenedentes bacterium ADurb.Bin179]|nr:MAG: hypothetical protein BWY09_00817 [Candidatus Hydrogenedentes bacterium ADurb.Bin179]